MLNHGKAVVIAAAVAAALSIGTPAVAQEQKTLKFSHVFPSSHWHWHDSFKIFEDAVTTATQGKIRFENYHAGQLGKEAVGLLKSGMADVAILVPSYETAKLPLTSVAEVPGLYSTSCEGTAKLWNIAKDGGALNNAEYKPLGIHILYVIVLPVYQVMTTNKKVTSLNDLGGLKIRANGAAMDKSVRLLGAIPVKVASSEIYDALTRGTVDGASWPIGSTRQTGLDKVLHYTVHGAKLGSASTLYGMRQKVWDGLSVEEKSAITKAAAAAQQHLCSYLDKENETETALLVKENNLLVTKLADQEAVLWNTRVTHVGEEWAKEMDSTGRPGSVLLKAFRDAPGK